MERDKFDVTTDVHGERSTNHSPEVTLRVYFHGSRDRFDVLLRDRIPGDPETTEIDLAFRARTDDGTDGTLFLTDRETGTYILEVETHRDVIEDTVEAVRTTADRADTTAEIGIVLAADGDEVVRFDADGLLVYNADGILQRDASLIPTDVEV